MNTDFRYPSGAVRKIRQVVKTHLRNSDLVKAIEPDQAHWIVMGRAGDDNWYYLGWITRVPSGSHVYFDAFALPEDYEVSYYNDTPPEGIPVVNADRCASAVRALVKHWEER